MLINFSQKIQDTCPQLVVATLECRVRNSPASVELWNEIEAESNRIINRYKLEDINKRAAIAATRQAYKLLGKDPNRYRPSAEALCRRIVRGLPLYRINSLVDIINLISIRTGYSIGGFDADKIQGDLTLGVGASDELFEAIGRGPLNIEGLPVYRDSIGGIGTPTSDNERTKISDNTTRLLMIINAYSGQEGLPEAIEYSKALLLQYAAMELLEEKVIF